MKQFKEDHKDCYYNPDLVKAGLIAALGGLFIYSLIAFIYIIIAHQ